MSDNNLMEHEYDGIQELDNHLPPWWINLFILSTVWAVIYFAGFHVYGEGIFRLQEDEYQAELANAKQAFPDRFDDGTFETSGIFSASSGVVTDEGPTVETFATDLKSKIRGGKIYQAKCIACHAPGGAGSVGPNLSDKYWIHGGSYDDIIRVINDGVPAKGMQPWKNQLTPKQIKDVTAYIYSLQGTFPANAKAPQGTVFEYEK